MRLAIWLPGVPRTKGSNDIRHNKWGRAYVVPNNVNLGVWTDSVIVLVRCALARTGKRRRKTEEPAIPAGPIRLDAFFHLPRPQRHFRKRGGTLFLREDAPTWHDKKPDQDKLERALFDALKKAGVYTDDAQVADGLRRKVWADPQRGPGVELVVEEIEEVSRT